MNIISVADWPFGEDCSMKQPLSLLMLSLFAVKAQAFTSKIPSEPAGNSDVAARASYAFATFHTLDVKNVQPGLCNAVSVNGCDCPFCTQLRSLGR